MRVTSSAPHSCFVIAAVMGVVDLTGAEQLQNIGSRLRSSNPTISAVITEAAQESPTFRSLVAAIQRSDGVVYVEEGRCGHGVRACLRAVTRASAQVWTRVTVNDPVTRAAVHAALDGAVEWFGQRNCRTLLTDFTNEQGCPLADRLDELRTSFEVYLQWLVIREADRSKPCVNPLQIAFTAAGSRVVFICGGAFLKVRQREPERATAVLIHEALHTLGLGEGGRFPSSREITRIVLARCVS